MIVGGISDMTYEYVVTLMSGYMDDTTHAGRPDGWQFLQKPFELDELLRCLTAG